MSILYPERMYTDDTVEREVFGPRATIVMRDAATLAGLTQADRDECEGLMIFRQFAPAAELAKFPKLRAIVRMGVGYDRVDRAFCA